MKKILTEKFSLGILIFGVFILFCGIIIFAYNDWHFAANQPIDLGRFTAFSDFIGGFVGPIWALVGVILFYIALTDQRKDFDTNREVLHAQTAALEQQIVEFELQRVELKETREVFQIQSKTLRKQQFESTFFSLINLHHLIVNSINLTKRVKKYKGFEAMFVPGANHNEMIGIKVNGRACFEDFARYFRDAYVDNKNTKNKNSDELTIVKDSYWIFFQKYQSDLGHYFRNLYHIFKFIKNSDEEDKQIYASMMRAQLSNDELFLLFYNCISNLGNEKFLPLIQEFHLLQNLNLDDLIYYKKHYGFYNESAYR